MRNTGEAMMAMTTTLALLATGGAMMGACRDFDVCADDTAHVDALPALLSDTGLDDPRVISYTPAFPLWSDGAEKRRFLWLPEGAAIDASDPDDWRFPAGTRLWKEFRRDGVHVETRLLQKIDDEAWATGAYLIRDDDSDGDLSVEGAQDVRGTAHDVPAAAQCFGCHGGRKSFALGFSAVQLANAGAGAFDLDAASAAGILAPSPAPDAQARLQVPGDDVERAALGYLHANCAHCHNQERPPPSSARCFDPQNDLDMALLSADLDRPEHTRAYRTLLGGAVVPGRPDDSDLVKLMAHRGAPGPFGPSQMPPLATERVDDDGVALLRRFIEAL